MKGLPATYPTEEPQMNKQMNTIAKITLNTSEIDTFANTLYNAGLSVGRREVRRVNVFISPSRSEFEPEHCFSVTFGDSTICPHPWGLLICSARWSTSRGAYIVSKNEFLDEEILAFVDGHMNEGLSAGVIAYNEAVEANEAIEALDKRAVARFDHAYGTIAYFQDREDAEEWAKANSGDHHYWSTVLVHRKDDDFIRTVLDKIEEDGGPAIDGLWYTFISKDTLAVEVS